MKPIVTGTLLVIFAATSFMGCGKEGDSQTIIPQKNDRQSVIVQTPTLGVFSEPIVYTGTVSGIEETVIRARVAETILDIPVAMGQYVQKGQIVVELDPSSGTTQFQQAKSNLELAQKNHDRNMNLLKAGGISQQMADQSRTQLEVAESNFMAIKKLLMVEAPISGTVTAITVSPGDFANVGTPMVTISKLSRLKTTVDVSSGDLAKIKNGQSVTIRLVDNPAMITTGTVYEIAKAANPATRTFETKIQINDAGQAFRSGLFVEVEFEYTQKEAVIQVPVTALSSINGSPAVFVVKDSTAILTPVKTGSRNNEQVAILEGITTSQQVVTSGALLLRNGDKIIPVVQ